MRHRDGKRTKPSAKKENASISVYVEPGTNPTGSNIFAPFWRTFFSNSSAAASLTARTSRRSRVNPVSARVLGVIKNKAIDITTTATMTGQSNNSNKRVTHGRQPNQRISRPGTRTSPRRQRHVAIRASAAAAAAANDNSNGDGTDDLFGPEGALPPVRGGRRLRRWPHCHRHECHGQGICGIPTLL